MASRRQLRRALLRWVRYVVKIDRHSSVWPRGWDRALRRVHPTGYAPMTLGFGWHKGWDVMADHGEGQQCHYCELSGGLRPFGPGGSWVCYSCATATPERRRAALGAFSALSQAALVVGPLVLLGDPEGPRPFDPREAL